MKLVQLFLVYKHNQEGFGTQNLFIVIGNEYSFWTNWRNLDLHFGSGRRWWKTGRIPIRTGQDRMGYKTIGLERHIPMPTPKAFNKPKNYGTMELWHNCTHQTWQTWLTLLPTYLLDTLTTPTDHERHDWTNPNSIYWKFGFPHSRPPLTQSLGKPAIIYIPSISQMLKCVFCVSVSFRLGLEYVLNNTWKDPLFYKSL